MDGKSLKDLELRIDDNITINFIDERIIIGDFKGFADARSGDVHYITKEKLDLEDRIYVRVNKKDETYILKEILTITRN